MNKIIMISHEIVYNKKQFKVKSNLFDTCYFCHQE